MINRKYLSSNWRRLNKLPHPDKLHIKIKDEHIAGIWVGDGNFNLVLKSGKQSAAIANGVRIRPRFILSQVEQYGLLNKVKTLLKEKYKITSHLQEGKNKRADNLSIEGKENCQKFLKILKKVNFTGPKRLTVELIDQIYKNIYDGPSNQNDNTDLGTKILIDFMSFFPKESPNALPRDLREKKCGFAKDESIGLAKPYFDIAKQISENAEALQNQQIKDKQFSLSPEFVAGLIAAEGSFYTGIFPSKGTNPNKVYAPIIIQHITITVHIDERQTLEAIAAIFNDTNPKITKKKNKNALVYTIDRVDLIERTVIPYLAKASFDFHKVKQLQFQTFLDIRRRLLELKHYEKEGFIQIAETLFNSPSVNDHAKRKYQLNDLIAWAEKNYKKGDTIEPVETGMPLIKNLEPLIEKEKQAETFGYKF